MRCALVGIITGWAQRGYAKGQMVNMTLDCADGTVSGVLWDDDLRRLSATPSVGSAVLARGQLRAKSVEVERTDDDGEVVVERVTQRSRTIRGVATLDIEGPVAADVPGGERLAWPEDDEGVGQVLELPLGRAGGDDEKTTRNPDMGGDVVVHRIGIGTIVHPDELLDLFDEVGGPPPCLYTTEGAIAVARTTGGIAAVVIGDQTPVPGEAELKADRLERQRFVEDEVDLDRPGRKGVRSSGLGDVEGDDEAAALGALVGPDAFTGRVGGTQPGADERCPARSGRCVG